MSDKTTVEIFGNRYVVQSDADPAYVKNVAEYVDAKMREIASRSTNVTGQRVAVMAALNVADELFQHTGGSPVAGSGASEERVEALISKINSVISKPL